MYTRACPAALELRWTHRRSTRVEARQQAYSSCNSMLSTACCPVRARRNNDATTCNILAACFQHVQIITWRPRAIILDSLACDHNSCRITAPASSSADKLLPAQRRRAVCCKFCDAQIKSVQHQHSMERRERGGRSRLNEPSDASLSRPSHIAAVPTDRLGQTGLCAGGFKMTAW